MKLDEKDRCCCGYMLVDGDALEDTQKFCMHCHRCFDGETGEQIENWGWKLVNGKFTRKTWEFKDGRVMRFL